MNGVIQTTQQDGKTMAQIALSANGYLEFLKTYQAEYSPAEKEIVYRNEQGQREIDPETGDYKKIKVKVDETKRLVTIRVRPGDGDKPFIVDIDDDWFIQQHHKATLKAAQDNLANK